MTTCSQASGRRGQTAAAEFLSKPGDETPGRSIRTPHGEQELSARRSEIFIVAELKTRTAHMPGDPEAAITAPADHAINHWPIAAIAVKGRPGRAPKINLFENVTA